MLYEYWDKVPLRCCHVVFTLNRSFYPTISTAHPVSILVLHRINRDTNSAVTDWDRKKNKKSSRSNQGSKAGKSNGDVPGTRAQHTPDTWSILVYIHNFEVYLVCEYVHTEYMPRIVSCHQWIHAPSQRFMQLHQLTVPTHVSITYSRACCTGKQLLLLRYYLL